jgi:hypothetical protein
VLFGVVLSTVGGRGGHWAYLHSRSQKGPTNSFHKTTSVNMLLQEWNVSKANLVKFVATKGHNLSCERLQLVYYIMYPNTLADSQMNAE